MVAAAESDTREAYNCSHNCSPPLRGTAEPSDELRVGVCELTDWPGLSRGRTRSDASEESTDFCETERIVSGRSGSLDQSNAGELRHRGTPECQTRHPCAANPLPRVRMGRSSANQHKLGQQLAAMLPRR